MAKLTLIVVACGTALGTIGGQFTNPTPKPPPEQPWVERYWNNDPADYAAEPVPQYALPAPQQSAGIPAWMNEVVDDWPAFLDHAAEYPDIAYAEPAYAEEVGPPDPSDIPAYRPAPLPHADDLERAARRFDRSYEPPAPAAAPRPTLNDPWAPSNAPPPDSSSLPQTPDGALPAIW